MTASPSLPPTVTAAFQEMARIDPGAVAIRTPGDAVTLTWAEYAARVRRVAEGLHALGVRRGDTVGIMLTNRPEFAVVDAGAMHLGAIAFSIYNTSSPEQIEYLFGNAENRVVITEPAFLDAVRRADDRRRSSTWWSWAGAVTGRSRWTSWRR